MKDKKGRFTKGNVSWSKLNAELMPRGENHSMYGRKHSPETLEKMRKIKMRKKASEETKLKMIESKTGKNNPMYGKKHSDETKRKISKGNKGKHNSPKTEFKKGSKVSEKTKLKLIESKTGKNHPMFGKNHSEETREKISLGKRNPSDETRIKMSKARKGKTYEEIYGKERAKKLKQRQKELGIGKNNPMYGKHHSEETKNKIRKIMNTPKMKKLLKERRAKQIFPKIDTKIEQKIQNFLSLLHIEFFTHKYMNIEHGYQCDIFIPKQETDGVIIPQKTIIECDGCFFHCCSICDKINKLKWTEERREIDKLRTKELIEKGFRVIRLWEHEIKVMQLNDLRNKVI